MDRVRAGKPNRQRCKEHTPPAASFCTELNCHNRDYASRVCLIKYVSILAPQQISFTRFIDRFKIPTFPETARRSPKNERFKKRRCMSTITLEAPKTKSKGNGKTKVASASAKP